VSDLPEPLQAELARVAGLPRVMVCSDFDGTLSQIVLVPDDARPIAGAVATLDGLARLPETECVLISGRTVAALGQLSGAGPDIVLVGSHGAEFSTGFATQVDDDQRALRERILSATTAIADDVAGVRLEVKPISVAVHVRQTAPDQAEQVLAAVRSGPATWPGVHVTEGKQVIELAVQPVDKGTAIESLREQFGADAVVFLGDDVTDERGFAVLAPGDIGIKVGDGATAAQYRVADPESALSALDVLLSGRRAQRP
jgi:trehalose 6-phosphate phosphatase